MSESRLVVITGVSKGLGRAMADGFAASGHRIAGCSRNAESVRKLSDSLGEKHVFRTVDVRDDGAVARFAAEVMSIGGVPDILINSAALINRSAPLWEVGAEEFGEVVDVNIKGVTNTIRHFVPPMIARGSGVVVNFSSGWGRSTSPDVAPYCATKWAVEGLTRALAQELPHGVAAIAFNPGIIDTDMLRSCFGSEASHYPDPDTWSKSAVPFLARLGPQDNGKALTCPGH